MKPLWELVTKGTRNQSVGLLTIGASMMICSFLAEARVSGPIAREAAQIAVIGAGLAATAALFRARDGGHRR